MGISFMSEHLTCLTQKLNVKDNARFRFKYMLYIFFTGLSLLLTSILLCTKRHVKYRIIRPRLAAILDFPVGSPEDLSINTPGCNIPALRHLGDDIRNLMHYPVNLTCYNSKPPLLGDNGTHIWIVKENIQYYNVSRANLICCYKQFYRPAAVEDIASLDNDKRIKYKRCTYYFVDIVKVRNDEFVKVNCSVYKRNVYEKLFIFAPKKKFMSRDNSTEMANFLQAYNVIVMGTTGISRQNFHRTMPKTLAYLKRLGTVEMLGYNVVGDSTFANIVPILLGLKKAQLKTTCLPHTWSSFDNCPFIWEWYKDFGYYTALAEDSSDGIFNYFRSGFTGQPTDYYTHPFMHEAKKYESNRHLCLHGRYFYQVLLDYIEKLTLSLKSSKLFGFFWESTMSHSHINYPLVMDEDYFRFFKRLNSSAYLKQSVVFFLSDHGIRSDILDTTRGRLEYRLPYLFVLVPKLFREDYPYAYNNLKLNSDRLTTPFDVHATLLDLRDLQSIENENILIRQKDDTRKKGISLFLPIPVSRTCKTARINDFWCTCQETKNLSPKSPTAKEASLFLIRHLNGLVASQRQCAHLKLNRIIEATEIVTAYYRRREFKVVVVSSPGSAVFEATVRLDRNWTVAGTVARLNSFADQSRCVHIYHLKLYCYCNNWF